MILTKKQIEEKFINEIEPIVGDALYEFHFTEGHTMPRKCVEEDLKFITKTAVTSLVIPLLEGVRERIQETMIDEVSFEMAEKANFKRLKAVYEHANLATKDALYIIDTLLSDLKE